MATEIERKFLVDNDSWRHEISETHAFLQGYFPNADGYLLRVRIVDETRAFLTVKGKREGISRLEFEYDIPVDDARQMMNNFCGLRIITKHRHSVFYHGWHWEIDEFDGRYKGLITAEIELPQENSVFDIPPWLGQDVSQDRRFANLYLATH